MKNRNLILSVLLWAVCSSVFAVTLPSSSFNAFETTNVSESFTIGLGSSFTNTYLSSASDLTRATCSTNKQGAGAMQDCEDCCIGQVYVPCLDQGGSGDQCGQAYLECVNACIGYSLPLGTPLLLLPFALVYAIVRRKRKEETL